MNYGQSIAVMILAGARMGCSVENVDLAKSMLEGNVPHPMFSAAMEREAISLHNSIRTQADVVTIANQHCKDLIAEYKLLG